MCCALQYRNLESLCKLCKLCIELLGSGTVMHITSKKQRRAISRCKVLAKNLGVFCNFPELRRYLRWPCIFWNIFWYLNLRVAFTWFFLKYLQLKNTSCRVDVTIERSCANVGTNFFDLSTEGSAAKGIGSVRTNLWMWVRPSACESWRRQ